MTKPLLLLDVDGVLNPFAASRRWLDKSDYRKRNVTVADGNTYPVWLNKHHGKSLLDLTDTYGFELVWCTDWQHEANEFIGPRLGLPELPVIEYTPGARGWKYEAALHYASDRPLAWLDDGFSIRSVGRHEFMLARKQIDTLLHEVDPSHGLRELDFRQIRIWAMTYMFTRDERI